MNENAAGGDVMLGNTEAYWAQQQQHQSGFNPHNGSNGSGESNGFNGVCPMEFPPSTSSSGPFPPHQSPMNMPHGPGMPNGNFPGQTQLGSFMGANGPGSMKPMVSYGDPFHGQQQAPPRTPMAVSSPSVTSSADFMPQNLNNGNNCPTNGYGPPNGYGADPSGPMCHIGPGGPMNMSPSKQGHQMQEMQMLEHQRRMQYMQQMQQMRQMQHQQMMRQQQQQMNGFPGPNGFQASFGPEQGQMDSQQHHRMAMGRHAFVFNSDMANKAAEVVRAKKCENMAVWHSTIMPCSMPSTSAMSMDACMANGVHSPMQMPPAPAPKARGTKRKNAQAQATAAVVEQARHKSVSTPSPMGPMVPGQAPLSQPMSVPTMGANGIPQGPMGPQTPAPEFLRPLSTAPVPPTPPHQPHPTPSTPMDNPLRNLELMTQQTLSEVPVNKMSRMGNGFGQMSQAEMEQKTKEQKLAKLDLIQRQIGADMSPTFPPPPNGFMHQGPPHPMHQGPPHPMHQGQLRPPPPFCMPNGQMNPHMGQPGFPNHMGPGGHVGQPGFPHMGQGYDPQMAVMLHQRQQMFQNGMQPGGPGPMPMHSPSFPNGPMGQRMLPGPMPPNFPHWNGQMPQSLVNLADRVPMQKMQYMPNGQMGTPMPMPGQMEMMAHQQQFQQQTVSCTVPP